MSKKILVTGADGQLGRSLKEIVGDHPRYEFLFANRQSLDITDKEAVAEFLDKNRSDWIINCAAFTDVDGAEKQQDEAYRVNVEAVRILAEESAKRKSGMVHISTDYVFDGTDYEPRTEESQVNPQTIYGKTKLEGEQFVLKNPRGIVLRSSWIYSSHGKNFLKTMLRLGAESREINVVGDQWGSPTSAHDLAIAIMTAVNMADNRGKVYGLYHFSNEGITCWADFAQQIMELSGLDCRVNHITSEEYPAVAVRPKYSVMGSEKFKKRFNVDIPEWEASLEATINKILSEGK